MKRILSECYVAEIYGKNKCDMACINQLFWETTYRQANTDIILSENQAQLLSEQFVKLRSLTWITIFDIGDRIGRKYNVDSVLYLLNKSVTDKRRTPIIVLRCCNLKQAVFIKLSLAI